MHRNNVECRRHCAHAEQAATIGQDVEIVAGGDRVLVTVTRALIGGHAAMIIGQALRSDVASARGNSGGRRQHAKRIEGNQEGRRAFTPFAG